jgi:hypothetical protein
MGSEFDDLVYWHLFTITVNYNTLHIEVLPNELRLLSDECCLKNLFQLKFLRLN